MRIKHRGRQNPLMPSRSTRSRTRAAYERPRRRRPRRRPMFRGQRGGCPITTAITTPAALNPAITQDAVASPPANASEADAPRPSARRLPRRRSMRRVPSPRQHLARHVRHTRCHPNLMRGQRLPSTLTTPVRWTAPSQQPLRSTAAGKRCRPMRSGQNRSPRIQRW